MKRNVVLQALARLAVSLIALFLLAAAPALAADKANINIIGYSEDDAYFAFEQFGEHDGSGGNFSNIYIIDLHAPINGSTARPTPSTRSTMPIPKPNCWARCEPRRWPRPKRSSPS